MRTQSDSTQIDVFLPIKTVTESNGSEHWTKKRKRAKTQHILVKSCLNCLQSKITLPCTVKLIRLGTRFLDDDNLVSSFKHVRDAIADHIHPGLAAGQADNDKNITWQYEQGKKGTSHNAGIRIVIN